MENSAISWTTHTFNPWMGCTKVSEACKFCYAERDMDHRYGKVQWGPNGTRVLTSDGNWRKPLKWNREAAEAGIRPRVFCASLADVFEEWDKPVVNAKGDEIEKGDSYRERKPGGQVTRYQDLLTLSDARARLFDLIDATPHLDWLLLTKRPENVRRMWAPVTDLRSADYGGPVFARRLDNVWLGCSVENQDRAEERIPELLKCRDRAKVLFLSCEPLLGPLDLHRWIGGIDWIIAGGESGPTARPSNAGWLYGLRAQCEHAGVPFHFKQWGEWAPHNLHPAWDLTEDYGVTPKGFGFWTYADAWVPCEGGNPFRQSMVRVGKKAAGRTLDGREWDELPTGASADA